MVFLRDWGGGLTEVKEQREVQDNQNKSTKITQTGRRRSLTDCSEDPGIFG